MSKTATAPKTPNYAYLADKEPSNLHHALKAFIQDHEGPEVDLKTIQAVLSAHGAFQKSDYNKNREDYKPRTAASIYKGGVTTSKNFEQYVINPETGEEERVQVEAPKAEEPKAVEAPKKAPARKTPAATEKKAPVRRTRKPAAAKTEAAK